MSNSSQQDLYSITLDGDIITNDTITITSISSSYDTMIGGNINYNVGDITIDLGNTLSCNSSDTISTSYIDNLQGILFPKEWIDTFPDWYKVQDMCKQYPSLEIAMRNLKTVYDLIKDDYDAKQNQDSNT